MSKVSTVELQIAERIRKFKGEALLNLHPFIDAPLLQGELYSTQQEKCKGS
jgi:RNA-directed DNA polymerase